ncbi:MAG: Stk1 family PASTA domain-containing Ser/Thr kinase [Actinomycetota bacterium]|jgi:serine/threonine-protein kinase|nr:Stk1 family PASTA domain-containing Ser/Thr kinase [Acidothermales bacterium]MDQ3431752.1 Stk1 family PASTA domain-containing Ser/Thr kinase [Actinomycetota bacterium]
MTVEPRMLGDRYELGEVLGRGGMAEVHLGQDTRLGRAVAVKTLRADLARDSTFQARFRREAQSAASLNHPSVVAVYDTGEEVVDGLPLPYIVMEYVEGDTLRELVRSGRRLLPDRALEITAEVLTALEYSHRNGIVHRDIKPGNVMLTPEGVAKVMDFGIARAAADSGATVTQTAAVLGTAQYLSPEQARGQPVDARSDLYSTGCLLYELLTGRPPFVGDSPVSVAYQHVREDPVPPSQIDPDIPPALDAIVLKALAKNPDNRYDDATQMRADIERALAGTPVAATPVLTGQTRRIAPVPPPPPEEEGRRRRVLGYVLLTLALLGVFALAALVGRQLVTTGATGDPRPGQVTVPRVINLSEEAATAKLMDAELIVAGVDLEFSDKDPGTVIDQTPEANNTVASGSGVRLTVSDGLEQVTVPNIVGASQQDAVAQLREDGLRVGKLTPRASDRPGGEVLRSNPAAGTSVDINSAVNLVVASGLTEVPEVRGTSEGEARSILETVGFEVSVVTSPTADFPPGEVIAQSPEAGSSAELASTVTITVAVTPPTPTATVTITPSPTPTKTTPSPTPSPTPTKTTPSPTPTRTKD